MKYPDVVESSSVKETRTLPLYLHGLQRNHLHLHPGHTPFSHDSHSYVLTQEFQFTSEYGVKEIYMVIFLVGNAGVSLMIKKFKRRHKSIW